MSAAGLSPLQRYQIDLEKPEFAHDPAQERAVAAFDELFQEIISNEDASTEQSSLKRLFRRKSVHRRAAPVIGLGIYLWGGVGRGKTYLMDCFYDALPDANKRRTHFHRFMKEVHERQKNYPRAQDPLRRLAADIAKETRILCFDEFFVSDVADAMILGRLIQALFDQGVCLVTTSNIPPDRLYENGLQRASFLPAIEALKSHTTVLHVDGPTDFRLRVLKHVELYHYPLDQVADQNLSLYFDQISVEPGNHNTEIDVLGRRIAARREADGILWADFTALCHGPRSAADYVEIAQCYNTVLMSGLHQLTWQFENEARRLINLVDEFYDRGVKLIISAECAMAEIYVGDKLRFEFERTLSRLQEMQSEEYLQREHLP